MNPRVDPFVVATPRIVIADADADTRSLYCNLLESYGYVVAEAADGPSALVAALSEPVSLVITDARLPIFDGYALCRVLQEDAATRAVPVIVLTSDATGSRLPRERNASEPLVREKPVQLNSLLDDIARLLRDPGNLPDPDTPPTTEDTPVVGLRKRSWARRHCLTTTPPIAPPALRCRLCDQPLQYCRSFVGGVNARHREQWDEYACPSGCATFEYRHRTRSVRELAD
jgi:CheY-like chemotaxis protein